MMYFADDKPLWCCIKLGRVFQELSHDPSWRQELVKELEIIEVAELSKKPLGDRDGHGPWIDVVGHVERDLLEGRCDLIPFRRDVTCTSWHGSGSRCTLDLDSKLILIIKLCSMWRWERCGWVFVWSVRLGGLAVFDITKVTTCITLLATEAEMSSKSGWCNVS